MSEYKIGALSDLISKTKDKIEIPLADLFTTTKKQKPAEPEKTVEEPTETKLEAKGISRKRRKAVKLSSDDDGDDNEEGTKYTEPSLKAKVRLEDAKKRINYDEETERRTVFVGNLPISTTKKGLTKMFRPYGKVESVRFRGAARPDSKTTKKVAVITKRIHENRTSFIGYVRFVEESSAVKSLELNGTKVKSHVIRVDRAINDTSKRDQKKAVFVGNLDFAAVVEEDALREHFKECGSIVDVRLIRDSSTGMGKGFGYVNFEKEEDVEKAIQLNGSEFRGRRIRVSRSVRKPKIFVAERVKSKVKTKKLSKKEFKDKVATTFKGQESDKSEKKKKKPFKKNKSDVKKKIIAKKLLRQ